MKVRKLEPKDAAYMLEWMHDTDAVRYLRADFLSKTIEDCFAFIEAAQDTRENLHLTIADDADDYMGTVSLKHISNMSSECAVAVRTCAQGKGYARYGMQTILAIGFREYHLKEIYWCISPNNLRCIRFVEKQGFRRCGAPEEHPAYTEEEIANLIWYRTTAC